jgi:hypothetical protein
MATPIPFDDGGPAFPQPIATTDAGNRDFSEEFGWGGMTLRDYFAGQVLPACYAAYLADSVKLIETLAKQQGIKPEQAVEFMKSQEMEELNQVLATNTATAAYALADAMVIARKKVH